MYTVINTMKILFKSIIILFLLAISSHSEIINEIKVDGNKRISSETIKVFSDIKIKKDLSLNELNDVIKKLYSTVYFSNVNLKIDNNILYISVVENPIVQTLKFEGVKNKRVLKILNEQVQMREKVSFIEKHLPYFLFVLPRRNLDQFLDFRSG